MPPIAELAERVRAAGHDPAAVLGNVPADRVAQLARGEVMRDNLCRTAPFTITRDADANGSGDGLTIEGYGAVFNSPTEINSWEGHFSEQIEPGAFKKSLRDSRITGGGTKLKMQFDHGHHPLLGGLPLGRWNEADEDDHGLHLRGRMYDNWLTQPFREAIADQGVDGMSFRFSVVKERWEDRDGRELKADELMDLLFWGAGDRGPLKRTLREVKVTEAGPVVWPAYQDTSVGARSAEGGPLVIDLAALRTDPRSAGYVVAQVDATIAAALAPPTIGGGDAGGTPVAAEVRWQAVGAAGLADLARSLVPSRREIGDPIVHTADVRTGTSAPVSRTAEPQTTGRPAAEHSPTGEPRGTEDAPAGTHSPTPRQGGPLRSRRDDLKARYREVLNTALTLPTT